MKKKIAVLLIGCGHQDGSEITEVVSTLISLSEFGADVCCFSFDRPYDVLNHVTGEKDGTQRNMLAEATRVTRSEIKKLSSLNVDDFDALVIPGGTGIAIHLSEWVTKGAAGKIDTEVADVIEKFHQGSRPIAAICISPVLVAKTLGSHGVSLTIGESKEIADEIGKTGADAVSCPTTDFVTDRHNKVISTPAYMEDATPFEVYSGIRAALKELV